MKDMDALLASVFPDRYATVSAFLLDSPLHLLNEQAARANDECRDARRQLERWSELRQRRAEEYEPLKRFLGSPGNRASLPGDELGQRLMQQLGHESLLAALDELCERAAQAIAALDAQISDYLRLQRVCEVAALRVEPTAADLADLPESHRPRVEAHWLPAWQERERRARQSAADADERLRRDVEAAERDWMAQLEAQQALDRELARVDALSDDELMAEGVALHLFAPDYRFNDNTRRTYLTTSEGVGQIKQMAAGFVEPGKRRVADRLLELSGRLLAERDRAKSEAGRAQWRASAGN